MSFLEIDNLHKTYPDGTAAVKGVSLDIAEGQFVVLLGPSGCGKTTTLRMIAGLEIASAGAIRLAGEDVTRRRPSQRDVGFVFQFYALYPHLCVEDNIAFPLHSVGLPGREVRQAVLDVAGRLGITPLLRRYPRQLSGGDQQRVSLARAMVRKPRLWLMDEPLGTLDADRRLEMREFIRRQQLEMKVTTIYVTHDQEEAMSLADRVVVMNGGEIRQADTPVSIYDRPADLFVANFVGSPGMNFIRGEITRDSPSFFIPQGMTERIPAARDLAPGPATLGVRSEHVVVGDTGPIEGEVVVNEYMGAYRSVHVASPVGRIVARATADDRWEVGSRASLHFDAAHLSFFNIDGRRIH